MKQPLICLGSASPRRRELLNQIGVTHTLRSANIDETPRPNEAPEVYVLRMALEKARAVSLQDGTLPVLGADTAVVADGVILCKPRNEAEGLAMLQRLSGCRHQVLTAIALVNGEREATRLSVSHVAFRVMSDAEMGAYWRTGEPADKAGGYGIQGYAATFIDHLDGSFSGVMGLPLFETAELLSEFGIDVSGLW